MRFDADSTFAPKPFKASSLKEAVVQRKTEREREKEGINWCGRNNSRLGDCWARTEEMSIPCVCVDLFVYNIYVCVWVWHACVSFFLVLEISPFGKYRSNMVFHLSVKMGCEVAWCCTLIGVHWRVIYVILWPTQSRPNGLKPPSGQDS